MADDPLTRHRRRQGAIIALLLLGPAPIALLLFLLGETTVSIGLVLAGTTGLVGWMLALYRRQRRDAAAAGRRVLPPLQVVGLLVVLGCIAGGVFLLPLRATAGYGLACLALATAIIYGMGARLRRTLKDPDEISAVLVLALMAVLIAFAGAFV